MPTWLDEFKDITDKRILLDLIKYTIRQVSIKYSKEKARKRREKVTDIEASLKTCEENCGRSPSPENLEQLEILKSEYNRETWYEKGEKSNKYYFLNLESHKKAKSSVRKVFNKDGILITGPKKILQEIEKFYSDLYKADSLKPSENLLNSFLANSEIQRLTAENAQACERKLTAAECLKSLQLLENNKSPGDDGLTAEFYKAFWNIVGNLMVDGLNYSFDHWRTVELTEACYHCTY